MKYFKSPYNWVGNKYKHIETINELKFLDQYSAVVDAMMGSGNILFNIRSSATVYIGNDKKRLLPDIYRFIYANKPLYSLDDVEQTINRFGRFSDKIHYYDFRDYWNEKYLGGQVDKEFCLETALLLKMCSNSMVRFNPKEGYFNQGFRGLGKTKIEFFTEQMKAIVANGLNELSNIMKREKYEFTSVDFEVCVNDMGGKSLIVFDPPYILRTDMYDTDFSIEDDERLLNFIKSTDHDFIYFNYLKSGDSVNKGMQSLIENNDFAVIDINNKTLSGQGRSVNIKDVKEVIVTNVPMQGLWK